MTPSEDQILFRELVDGLPLMVWVHGPSGEQRLVNETFCDYFGVDAETLAKDGWQSLVHPDDVDRYAREFFECVRERRRFHSEVRVKRKDGQWRWLECWAKPRFRDDGELIGFVGTSADVTDRRALEKQLKESDRRKDTFLAMLSHEIRNPLAAIRSAAELVGMVSQDDPHLRRAHGVLVRQSTHIARLIEGLLEISRIARGKVTLSLERLDLRKVIEAVLQDRREQLVEQELELVTDLPDEGVWLVGDGVRLTQVIDNLVTNSMKFTEGPGTITLRLRQADDQAELTVRDTGAGIEPALLPHIFDPFRQDSRATGRQTGGLGLGLALVKGLVELHGGSVEARSEGRGTGAEFVVRLPLGTSVANRDEGPTRPRVPTQRILLVEDNADAAQMLRDLLELQGHSVVVATTGAEGLTRLRDEGADVLLCDLGLPGMSGYEVVRSLREDASLCHLPAIAVTGYGQAHDREKSRQAGFDEHLTKPVNLETLQNALLRLCGR